MIDLIFVFVFFFYELSTVILSVKLPPDIRSWFTLPEQMIFRTSFRIDVKLAMTISVNNMKFERRPVVACAAIAVKTFIRIRFDWSALWQCYMWVLRCCIFLRRNVSNMHATFFFLSFFFSSFFTITL